MPAPFLRANPMETAMSQDVPAPGDDRLSGLDAGPTVIGSQTAPPREASFLFTGDTAEYFRIWIVNACLSLVTLGIWSAWAKVRTTRYLRAHTTLDGFPFTYDASPVAILRGRILAVAFVGTWTALGYVAPVAQLLLLVPAAFIVPWLIKASLRFNARVTTYRNVGFSFSGGYGDAFGYFIVAPVLSVFTLYLLIPWVVFRQRVWQAEKTAWGNLPLSLRARAADFYAAHLPAIIMIVVAFVTFISVVGLAVAGTDRRGAMPAGAWVAIAILYALVLFATLVTHAAVTRVTLDSLRVGGGARVTCRLDALRYAWILASNALCSLVTLGLLYPWGEIRRLRYLAAATSVSGLETFDGVTGTRAAAGSAAGEEIADAFDIELGF